MKNYVLAAFAGLFAMLLTSCASVKFYSGADRSEESGLKFYTAKPYLQVERDLNNNFIKSGVIYLPDLSEPMYLVVKHGLGSGKLDVKITDGTISALGIAVDQKIAETTESLAALLSKTVSAVTDLSALKGIPQPSAALTTTELYEILITREGTSLKKVEIK